jgi:hypothetical protein
MRQHVTHAYQSTRTILITNGDYRSNPVAEISSQVSAVRTKSHHQLILALVNKVYRTPAVQRARVPQPATSRISATSGTLRKVARSRKMLAYVLVVRFRRVSCMLYVHKIENAAI